MDRNPPETEGILATKPNGQRNNIQPIGTHRSTRKSTGNPESKENSITSDIDVASRAIPRPTHTNIPKHRQSDSLITQPIVSPSPNTRVDRSTAVLGISRSQKDTRIPRPKTTGPITNDHSQTIPENREQSSISPMRQPMDFKAAFNRAREQTDVDLRQAFNMANTEFNDFQGIDGSPSPAPRSFRRESRMTNRPGNGASTEHDDLKKQLAQFDRTHQLGSGGGPLNGLFDKNRVGTKVPRAGRAWTGQATDDNQGDGAGGGIQNVPTTNPVTQANAKATGRSLLATSPHLGRIGADVPIPTIESEANGDAQTSRDYEQSMFSPEKNMNWHLDADFTAGDLQISASPRVTLTKPSSDSGHKSDAADQAGTGTPAHRRTNDRLRQIKQREVDAARTTFAEDMSANKMTNNRLDEIRAREMEALSRRAVASSRLDEIRIRNSEPRSESPENRKVLHKTPPKEEKARPNSQPTIASEHISDIGPRGEPIRDTPVVVYKSTGERPLGESKREALAKSDSHDLLRRLARATSLSPGDKAEKEEPPKVNANDNFAPAKSPEKQMSKVQHSEMRNLNRSLSTREERRLRNLEIKNPRDRPTVGFADLIRVPSDDSIQGKRPSKPNSEIDPTDRIEAELNLFAPLDNYSERGSNRAPSPVQSEPADEETPRPVKVDPLTLPTPRVTGAYVETPATVRVKEEGSRPKPPEIPAVAPDPKASSLKPNLPPTKHSLGSTTTDRARSLRRSSSRSSSVPAASRRARSSSRRRRPLINTAKPPTVREDILAILRANDIDDSTLENLDSILADREVKDQELKQMVNDSVLKVEGDLDMKFSEMTDRERELEAYDRMSRSLKTGLLGIRSAKKGIERLEDKVIHHDRKDEQLRPRTTTKKEHVQEPPPSPIETDSIPVYLPRLYRRHPKFKLTPWGIFAILALIWYALESTFSSLYAGPDYACIPNVPCDWSPNEPYFPYTMPFMLDEWVTGGKGRALTLRVGEEVGDILAEVSDWATNTDFTLSDPRYMNVWQRKRHLRRLRKHGLVPKWTPPDGYRLRYPDWQAAKKAKEMAQDLGLDEEDETMSVDEVLR